MKTKTEQIEKFVNNLISEDEQAMLLVGTGGPDTNDKASNDRCTNYGPCDSANNSECTNHGC